MEMGMRGTGQIAELAALAPPDVACITAIAPVHLELLGTVEAVAAAKAEVLQAPAPGRHAVVPAGRAAAGALSRGPRPGVTVIASATRPDLDLDLGLAQGVAAPQRRGRAGLLPRPLGRVPAGGRRDRGGAVGAAGPGAAAGRRAGC